MPKFIAGRVDGDDSNPPPLILERLHNPPKHGQGVHQWLYSIARQLHTHWNAQQVFEEIKAQVHKCDRPVPDKEIWDAVHHAKETAYQLRNKSSTRNGQQGVWTPPASSEAQSRRIERDNEFREQCRIQGAIHCSCLAELREASPIQPPDWDAEAWLDTLWPQGDPWLCLATTSAMARSRRRTKWRGKANEQSLIVPSQMTGPSGMREDGQRSHRCLDNTGPREWVVIEFDPKRWVDCSPQVQALYPGGEIQYVEAKLNEQASLHFFLRIATVQCNWPRLRLVVYSGGKSLHGWYGPLRTAQDRENARMLMACAEELGADPSTWNRCQLIRLPGGRRPAAEASIYITARALPDWGGGEQGDWVQQTVFYYDSWNQTNA
jgi:hypothetical protein